MTPETVEEGVSTAKGLIWIVVVAVAPDVVALVIPVAPVKLNVVLAVSPSAQRVVEVIEKAIVRVELVEVAPVTVMSEPLNVIASVASHRILQIVLLARRLSLSAILKPTGNTIVIIVVDAFLAVSPVVTKVTL